MYSNYPLSSLDIIKPKPSIPSVNTDRCQLIDPPISILLKKNVQNLENSYLDIVNTISNFKVSDDSNNMTKRVKYNDYIKKHPEPQNVYEMYNNMTIYNNNVSKKVLDTIQGDINENKYNSTNNMYNPIYSSIDLTNNNFIPNNDIIDRMYQPYDPQFGPHKFTSSPQ